MRSAVVPEPDRKLANKFGSFGLGIELRLATH
jgi:hypothetical protein